MATEDDDSATRERSQRIVVGVDGSPTSLDALEWAVREARLRRATLEIVHTSLFRQVALELDAFAKCKELERSILDAAVAKARAMAPEINVRGRITDPPAGESLVDVSKDADLLVVGSRGLGHLKKFTLGSVSQDCVHHAQCPVAIIRPATSHKALGAEHV